MQVKYFTYFGIKVVPKSSYVNIEHKKSLNLFLKFSKKRKRKQNSCKEFNIIIRKFLFIAYIF